MSELNKEEASPAKPPTLNRVTPIGVVQDTSADQNESPSEGGSGIFQRSLVWLSLVLFSVCAWQLWGLSGDLERLQKQLNVAEESLIWLEDSQKKKRVLLQEELNDSQAQITKMQRNLKLGGIYGKEVKVKTQLSQLDSRVNELDQKFADMSSKNLLDASDRSQQGLNVTQGKWAINLNSFEANNKAAEEELAYLSELGVPASVTRIRVKNETWLRISISGFGTYEDAKTYAEDVLAKREIGNYWIRLES